MMGLNGLEIENNKKGIDKTEEAFGKKKGINSNPFLKKAMEQGLKDTCAMTYKAHGCSCDKTHDGRRLIDHSSGNFPRYFPGRTIRRVREAMRRSLEEDESGAYFHGMEGAKEEIAPYYGVPPENLFFSEGISGGIQALHHIFLNGTGEKVMISDESYPTHFATALTVGALGTLVRVPRKSISALPDFSSFSPQDNPFLQVAFSTFIPYENPNPVVYTPEVFRNSSGTGIFDLNEAAFNLDGKLRPVVLDMIYHSFSWPQDHMTIERIRELSDERNILIFMNSLSKAFLEPNKRAGVMAVYIPKKLRSTHGPEIFAHLIRNLKSLQDRLLNPISNVSMAGLVAAHKILQEERSKPDPELEEIRGMARFRFTGEGGRGGNQAAMKDVPYIVPLHPMVVPVTSGYNVFRVEHASPPWADEGYKRKTLARLDDAIAGRGGPGMAAVRAHLHGLDTGSLAASDMFCLDLMMSKGVAYAPFERFYKLGSASESMVAFRPIMIASTEEFQEATKLLKEFLTERLG